MKRDEGKLLTVVVAPEVHEVAKAHAKRLGLSMSAWVRETIDAAIEAEKEMDPTERESNRSGPSVDPTIYADRLRAEAVALNALADRMMEDGAS